MTNWLVTGGTGLLGGNALESLRQAGPVIGVARSVPLQSPAPFESVDLSDPHARSGLVAEAGATAVLHAAALASIEACEADPDLAHRLNVQAAADLAGQARDEGAAFIYVSTDAVFDGKRGGYSEADPTSPVSEYGRSKARGEEAVLDANPDSLVARVNFYGWSPSGARSLAEFFVTRLREGLATPGFTDVVVNTLHVGFLVESLVSLVAAGARGIVHVVSSESTSKYDFGRRLADMFELPSDLVRPARSSDHLAHHRGSDLSLDTSLAASYLGVPLPNQQTGLERLLAEYRASLPDRLRLFNARNEAV